MNHTQLLKEYQRMDPEEKMLFVQKLLKMRVIPVEIDMTDPIIASALCSAMADQILRGGESLGK